MIIKTNDETKTTSAKKISKQLAISDDLAYLLVQRGLDTAEKAKNFLYPSINELTSPYEYFGMKEAVEKISGHIEKGHKIVVYGDYDCDGISAVTILMRAFGGRNIDINYYIPVRQEEGYGLNCDAIDKIVHELNPDLLITVDCGITAIKEVEYALQKGLDVVVTDHHTIGSELPDCIVIDPCFNPQLTQLCGAGIAFTLVRALFGEEYALRFIDVCAIATVADIVPLVGDNRTIVKYGLETIRKGRAKVGINELIYKAGLDKRHVTSYDIGFKIAPRLNAAGRLSVAHSSVNLLMTEDATIASFIAEELSMRNTERQDIGKQISNEAMQLLYGYDFGKNHVIVLNGKTWNEGVIGISAAKIAEYFNMPTILLTEGADGAIKGSARSISGINIVELIATQKDLLSGFGGHAMAAGLSMPKENFAKFFEGINEKASKFSNDIFKRKVSYEAEIPVKNITYGFIKELELLEPYGYMNPSPVFCDDEPDFKLSRIGYSNHDKGKTTFAEIVCFNKHEEMPAYVSAEKKSVIYSLGKNYFNGNEYEQIRIKKLLYKDFSVATDTLEARFAEFSHKIAVNGGKTKPSKRAGVKLDVFFDETTFKKFFEKYDNVRKLYSSCDDYELTDTAVLSPKFDFPFGYFDVITVHGKITEKMKKFFETLSANFVDSDKKELLFSDIKIDEMRQVFVKLKKFSSLKFKNADELYFRVKNDGTDCSYENFIVYFYILRDVELIKTDDNDILIVNNRRTDLNLSPIFRYIYG